jgi:hypothetical protein
MHAGVLKTRLEFDEHFALFVLILTDVDAAFWATVSQLSSPPHCVHAFYTRGSTARLVNTRGKQKSADLIVLGLVSSLCFRCRITVDLDIFLRRYFRSVWRQSERLIMTRRIALICYLSLRFRASVSTMRFLLLLSTMICLPSADVTNATSRWLYYYVVTSCKRHSGVHKLYRLLLRWSLDE